jgi:hypothetical protein
MEDKKFVQKTEIFKFPKFLIIQLGRFVSGGKGGEWWANKINTDVVFPIHDFNLGEFFPSSSKKQPKPVYELFAIAVSFYEFSTCFL